MTSGHDTGTHCSGDRKWLPETIGYKREKEARVWENVRGNLAHPANFRLSVSLEEEEARSLSL